MKRKEKVLFFIYIFILSFLLQIIKEIIITKLTKPISLVDGLIELSLVKNTGVAFSIGNNNNWIFIILNIFIITGLIIYYLKNKYNDELISIGMIFVLSGGISNLLDRILRGYVVDYIDINELINYPIFNLEDIMIVIGVIIIGICILKKEKNERIRN